MAGRVAPTSGLDAAPLHTRWQVQAIAAEGLLRRRLLDLGLVPGTVVVPVLAAPSGDPRAYQVRGTTVALRQSDAALLRVVPVATEQTVTEVA